MWHRKRLSQQQIQLVQTWLTEPELIHDHSWNLIDTTVLEVRAGVEQLIIKAGGPGNHHLDREAKAFSHFTQPLAELGLAARVRALSAEARIIVLEYLEGELVEGTPAEMDPGTYEQAGQILRIFHSQASRLDPESDRLATERALAWLDAEHRITKSVERLCRTILLDYRPRTVNTVPTHGDWQPRNWLIHKGELRVIDFGRFAWRAAETDLVRLTSQQWQGQPELESAFFAGYGDDPRERDPECWSITMLREAIATAAWSYQVSDSDFEAHGHRMLSAALADL